MVGRGLLVAIAAVLITMVLACTPGGGGGSGAPPALDTPSASGGYGY